MYDPLSNFNTWISRREMDRVRSWCWRGTLCSLYAGRCSRSFRLFRSSFGFSHLRNKLWCRDVFTPNYTKKSRHDKRSVPTQASHTSADAPRLSLPNFFPRLGLSSLKMKKEISPTVHAGTRHECNSGETPRNLLAVFVASATASATDLAA